MFSVGADPRLYNEDPIMRAQLRLRSQPGFELRSGHVGFEVNKVALGQVFSENFGFPC
jgi:hypothetical protein